MADDQTICGFTVFVSAAEGQVSRGCAIGQRCSPAHGVCVCAAYVAEAQTGSSELGSCQRRGYINCSTQVGGTANRGTGGKSHYTVGPEMDRGGTYANRPLRWICGVSDDNRGTRQGSRSIDTCEFPTSDHKPRLVLIEIPQRHGIGRTAVHHCHGAGRRDCTQRCTVGNVQRSISESGPGDAGRARDGCGSVQACELASGDH